MRAMRCGCALLSGVMFACGTSGGTADGTGGASSGGATSATGGTGQGGIASGGASGGAPSSSGGSAAGGTNHGGSSSGGASSGGTNSGGANASGGVTSANGGSSSGGSGGASGGNPGTTLPALKVEGPLLKDATGKTIILRGSSLIDIGTLYAQGPNSIDGITTRMDKVAAAGVQGHVVRLPVYPKITYNSGVPACSPVPYPVGTGPAPMGMGPMGTCTPQTPLSADEYVTKVLKPAVDYGTSKGLYVIIDYHQIDNAASGTSATDAKTFWTDIAPKFASYNNVIFEAFNEPIDNQGTWASLKPAVQGIVDVIRAGAPNNVIIVPSNTWCQRPGDAASDPPTGKNFMYTAHIYPNNWKTAFQTQVSTAVTKAPVFITEWGFNATDPQTFGTGLQTTVDGNGASWTAWVTDNEWGPPMFSDMAMTQLNTFGSLVKTWLAAKANDHWVQ